MTPAMRIRMLETYLYQDKLVTVCGAEADLEKGGVKAYRVRWTDADGDHNVEVQASDLSAAPTLIEMKQRYDEALQIICKQANRIEALEAERDRALQLNAMNRAERDRMYDVIQRYRLETGLLS